MTTANERTEENKDTSSNNGTKTSVPKGEKWGYDLYPERRGGRHSVDWFRAFFMLEGRDNMQKIRCEKNVYNCVRTSTYVPHFNGGFNQLSTH